MPQIQNIDDSADYVDPLGSLLQGFTDRREKLKETDALREVYSRYQSGGDDIVKALFDLDSNPDISPTQRVNSTKNLMQLHKQNQVQQKQVQKEIKSQQDRENLKKAGATDQQLALFDASTVGGKTKVTEQIVDEINRNKTPGEIAPDVKDYDAGLTPKERVARQDDRFKLQTPLLNKNSEQINGIENESMSIDLLNELNQSGKVGKGVHNLNINPKTGDLLIPQFGTPEEQLFVKTVNDFTVKAKDSFGARVTNFELDRFMQRLPTLANSQEGRALILRQMSIINKINALEKKAIQGVFDKYGVRNIDYVDAENLARQEISGEKEALRKQYLDIEQTAKKHNAEVISKIKTKLPEGKIAMRTPEGKIKAFNAKDRQNLEDKGYVPL